MSGPALLDVNLLVALFDPDHVHHELAHDWFADHASGGWATCPVTENGFVRVIGNPAYGTPGVRASELVRRLAEFCRSRDHVFWPDAISLRDASRFKPGAIGGHRHVTDVYLLGLATTMKGRLVTFDRSIPLTAVAGAKGSNLEVVSAVDRP